MTLSLKHLSHCSSSLFFLLAFFLQTSVCLAIPLTVTVEGVEGDLYTNILARLKISLQQKKDDLTLREIRRLHKQAPKDIEEALAPYGYYSVLVNSSLTEKDESWHALYRVKAGAPTLLTSLSIVVTGAGKDDPFFQDLTTEFPLKKGMQLQDSLYEMGKKKILTLAIAHGYVRARFTEHKILVKREEGQAEISLALDTGPLYHFGETESRQELITPELFRSFIPYQEGDVYSLQSLNDLQASLYATSYFSQVLVESKFSKTQDEQIPVEVSLFPAKRNRYSFGVGYGTDTGVRGSFEWRNRLFNRYGHKPSFTMQLSEKNNLINGDYTIPVFDPRYDTLSLNGKYLDETWDDTQTNMLSYGFSVNHETPKHQYGVGLEYRNERYTVGVTSGTADLLMPSAYWTYILARDRVNVEDGIRFSASVKGAEKDVLSTTSFLQFRVSGKAIVTPLENWRILGRGTVGVTAMESIDALPPSLRFYTGGDQSVRGYGYKTLGPKDASGVVIGGQYLVTGSIEIERRLTSLWSLAAFYDAGNALDDISADLKHGAGVGVRMTFPFGQVRLDVASALSEDGCPLRVHLSVGADL
ncbi:MAG: autotransporter assembly complex protein TamA [Proteobacteria bacterium]|nr:autotransporter assembly complex protein TamA [Pseudomonadota bacterium]